MTLETTAYNVEGSAHKLIKSHVADIKVDLAAAPPAGLGKTYALQYFSQSLPLAYPAVTGWFYLPDGQDERRHRRFEQLQLEVWTQSPTPDKAEARRLAMLIRSTLIAKLGFTQQKARYRAEFPIKDYFSNPSAPASRGKCFIEMISKSWRELPDQDPLVVRQQADFKLIFV